MKKGGGILVIVAGSLSVFMGFITLVVGGIGGALEAEGAETVVNLGWGGVFLSFVIIVLGIATISAKSIIPPLLVLVFSIVTAIAGGSLVAIFMVLSFLGGILGVIGSRQENKERAPIN